MHRHEVYDSNKSKAEKRACWDAIIQDYLDSGMGYTSYCRAHGLIYDHLSYYVRTYKEKQRHAGSASFVPVELSDAAISKHNLDSPSHLSLQYGEYKINLHEGFNRNLLLELLDTLRRIPC